MNFMYAFLAQCVGFRLHGMIFTMSIWLVTFQGVLYARFVNKLRFSHCHVLDILLLLSNIAILELVRLKM